MRKMMFLILVVLCLSSAHSAEKPKGRLLGSATIQIFAPRPDRIVEVYVAKESWPNWTKVIARLADGTERVMFDTNVVVNVQNPDEVRYSTKIWQFRYAALSPNRKKVAVATNGHGDFDDWVGIWDTDKKVLEYLLHLTIDKIIWHPNSRKFVGLAVPDGGVNVFYVVEIIDKKAIVKSRRRLDGFFDLQVSPDKKFLYAIEKSGKDTSIISKKRKVRAHLNMDTDEFTIFKD